jgi:hypothetical protein
MMKKFRDHFFKIIILSLISVLLIFVSSCSSNKTTSFCEGVTPKGKGVNCGIKFSSGDVTALIKPKSKIETNSVTIKVFTKSSSSVKYLFSDTIKVDKEKNYIIHNIRFLNPGKYKIVTISGKKEISQGTIEIVE